MGHGKDMIWHLCTWVSKCVYRLSECPLKASDTYRSHPESGHKSWQLLRCLEEDPAVEILITRTSLVEGGRVLGGSWENHVLELRAGTRALYHDCMRKEPLIAGQWPCHLLDNSKEKTGDDRCMLSMLNNVCGGLLLDWIPLTSCSVMSRASTNGVQFQNPCKFHGKLRRCHSFKHMLHVNHFLVLYKSQFIVPRRPVPTSSRSQMRHTAGSNWWSGASAKACFFQRSRNDAVFCCS